MLVVTLPHNIATWVDEIRATTPEACIRVISGIGNPRFPDRRSFRQEYAVCDLETLRQTPASPERPVWALLKRDSAKMTYPYHTPARVINPTNTAGFRPRLYRVQGELKQPPNPDHPPADTCLHCWVAYAAYPKADLKSRNSRCPNCEAFLAGPDILKPGDRRYPWADYISKRMPRWADLFIADEVHQFKGKRSAQGDVYRRLAQASHRTLALTGTVIGGKVQEAFYLLTAFSPGFHRQFGYHQLTEFNNRYGRVETTYARDGGYYPETRDGARSSVRKGRKLGVKVLNGFHPALLDHFWPHTIFTRIHDIRRDLKHPEIHARLIPMVNQQAEAYQQMDAALRSHLIDYHLPAPRRGNRTQPAGVPHHMLVRNRLLHVHHRAGLRPQSPHQSGTAGGDPLPGLSGYNAGAGPAADCRQSRHCPRDLRRTGRHRPVGFQHR